MNQTQLGPLVQGTGKCPRLSDQRAQHPEGMGGGTPQSCHPDPRSDLNLATSFTHVFFRIFNLSASWCSAPSPRRPLPVAHAPCEQQLPARTVMHVSPARAVGQA